MIRKKITKAALAAGMFFLLVGFFYYTNKETFLVDSSINKGLDFLYKNQLPDGEFKTMMCLDSEMESCFYESSPYITTFALEAMRNMDGKKVLVMKNKGLSFLLHEEESGGLWSVWTSENSSKIVPDVDDTVTVSDILKENNIRFESNTDNIKKNVGENSLFYTWFDTQPEENETDCIVNANTLRYLQENNPAVCDYINNAIKSNTDCSIYSSDMLAVYYFSSRAYSDGVTCLGENKNIIIERLKNMEDQQGSFGNDLQISYALNTLMDLDYFGKEVQMGIAQLIKKQNPDGSWQMENFFSEGNFPAYYGSQELTTSLAIEALHKYATHKNNGFSEAAIQKVFSWLQ